MCVGNPFLGMPARQLTRSLSAMRRTLALVLCALLITAWAGPAWAAERPNILWLVAEDFGPELGCYGTSQVSSPNLDRLASQGARYTRAYTTAPGCSAK